MPITLTCTSIYVLQRHIFINFSLFLRFTSTYISFSVTCDIFFFLWFDKKINIGINMRVLMFAHWIHTCQQRSNSTYLLLNIFFSSLLLSPRYVSVVVSIGKSVIKHLFERNLTHVHNRPFYFRNDIYYKFRLYFFVLFCFFSVLHFHLWLGKKTVLEWTCVNGSDAMRVWNGIRPNVLAFYFHSITHNLKAFKTYNNNNFLF